MILHAWAYFDRYIEHVWKPCTKIVDKSFHYRRRCALCVRADIIASSEILMGAAKFKNEDTQFENSNHFCIVAQYLGFGLHP